MYTREEASQLRSEFWTTFGKYISPHLSSEGDKVNWVNYKTGIKNLYFRMNATHEKAYIAIEFSYSDHEIQKMFFEQFEELKTVFEETMQEKWEWILFERDEHGKQVSRIFKEFAPVNIYSKENWPKLISFFKPRMLLLDEFWGNARYTFDDLKSLL